MARKIRQSRRRLWRGLERGLVALVLLYVMAAVGCAAFQRRLLYFPTVEAAAASDRRGLSRGFERWTNSAGENIGWKRTVPGKAARGTVIVTHGNGGCAADRIAFAKPLNEWLSMDVFILEYPGFGDRTGVPSQRTLFDAAEDALASLRGNGPVYLLGESLGTGVAAYLAGTHPKQIAGVLLFAPYNTLVDVAQHHVRILPARWLMVDFYPSEEYLSRYNGPVAIVVGGRDRVVPQEFGQRLFEGYDGPKRLWEFPDGSHESIHRQDSEFWNEIGAFWNVRR